MPFYISANTFKQQAKLLVNHWPFKPIKTSHARNVLSQLYGYKDNHHYLKQLDQDLTTFIHISEDILVANYKIWVKRLADLGSMNQVQAKIILHKLWPGYLSEKGLLSEKLYKSSFRFHGECTDFIDKAQHDIEYLFDDRPAVKDSIEALGVPHTEVGGIKVDGRWVNFEHQLMDGQKVEIFSNPCLESTHLLPYKPEEEISFLLDVHLGGLARYLRLAGFNCLHEHKDYGDALLAEIASTENHILLTRDVGLLKRSKLNYGRWIRSVLPEDQFKEVVMHYQLTDLFKPLSRCVKCNGKIKPVNKKDVKSVVPPGVFEWQEDFKECIECAQVYWKGSHFEKIMNTLNNAKR